jgi:hypothetical protein
VFDVGFAVVVCVQQDAIIALKELFVRIERARGAEQLWFKNCFDIFCKL